MKPSRIEGDAAPPVGFGLGEWELLYWLKLFLKRSVRGIAYLIRRSRNPRGKLQLEFCTEAR
jgi:hypothetical protein